MYDLAIIGGGPAGVAGGIYAARKQLKTILITEEFGGQSVVSEEIQNWIGNISISGKELSDMLKSHLDAYAKEIIDIAEGEKAVLVEKKDDGNFIIKTSKEKEYTAKTILVATGAHRRKLKIEGAEEFDQKGLTYCASCDGPMFKDMDVAVIGGGNAAFETAAQLLAYAKSVTLLNRSPEFRADPITVKKVLANPKMKAITNAETLEIKGDKFVSGLVYKDKESDEKRDLEVKGIFVEIGMVPSTEAVKDVLELDDFKRVVTNPKNQQTSTPGIWAAGDCTNELYHQNNIAAGDAVKAIEDIYMYHHAR